jgi:hypothetical protein
MAPAHGPSHFNPMLTSGGSLTMKTMFSPNATTNKDATTTTTIVAYADTPPLGATRTAFLANDGKSVSYSMTSDSTSFETLNKSFDENLVPFFSNAADDATEEDRLSYAILLYIC